MIKKCGIRLFEPGDLPALHCIRAAAFKPVFQSFREIVGEQIAAVAFADAEAEQAKLLDDLCETKPDQQVYVVERDGEIVGFCTVLLDRKTKLGEIGLNAVDPKHAGKGVGSWMYEFALEQMKQNGMTVATVGTGGDPSHAPARRAYENAGFGPAIPNFYYYKSL